MTEHTETNAPSESRWVGTWATTLAPVDGIELAGQTVRMICHASIGGARLRIRISNAYGRGDLVVGAAHVALRDQGPSVDPDSDRELTFNGSGSITIPAGALVVSDPVDLDVSALADVAVSVYLPGTLTGSFQVTGHDPSHQTGYISAPGDFAAQTDLPVERETEVFLFVSGIEVHAGPQVGGIVALGDSLTEGNISELDANHRWPDQLARRLVARRDGRQLGVVNQGFGGGRMLHEGNGESGAQRFDRDVLAQPGVTHLVVMLGINDLRNSFTRREEEIVSAEQLITGLQQMAVRAHTAGLRILCATLTPFENETFHGGFYTTEGEATRQAVNAWIRESDIFDGVIDFEAAVRDPDHPTRLSPEFDCGDHLHPSDDGYLRMGDSIDLGLFD